MPGVWIRCAPGAVRVYTAGVGAPWGTRTGKGMRSEGDTMSQELYAIIVMGLTIIGLGWNAKRDIKSDAHRAHEEIGKNIDLVRQDIRELRGDVKELNTRVSRVEGKLGLPSA